MINKKSKKIRKPARKVVKKVNKPIKKVKAIKKIQKSAKIGAKKKEPQKKVGGFGLLRGMKDVLGEEQKYWDFIQNKVEKLGPIYGFRKIEMPILEETALFNRAVGEDTNIVQKEMFSFVDKGGESVCLRPEATASVVRAYIEHGMLNRPQPVKFWYWGPMFRREKPQSGRQRQFTQFGFEVIGAPGAVIDSQLIILFYKICEELKLEVTVQINSIGCPECRDEYKKALVDYLKVKKNFLCDDCKERIITNPLRILDCKSEECQRLVAEAPQIVDFLCDECKDHFIKVLEGLDECAIPYNLNSRLVRGLDYYSKTVFEIWPDMKSEVGSQKSDDANGTNKTNETNETNDSEKSDSVKVDPSNFALGGGGRYDGLVEILGGREATPAVGFAAGVERIILALKKQEVKIRGIRARMFF